MFSFELKLARFLIVLCETQAGYFWFFYGDAINKGPLARANAEQFYL